MLSSVTDYVLWILGTAIPAFLSHPIMYIFIAIIIVGVLISYLIKIFRFGI